MMVIHAQVSTPAKGYLKVSPRQVSIAIVRTRSRITAVPRNVQIFAHDRITVLGVRPDLKQASPWLAGRFHTVPIRKPILFPRRLAHREQSETRVAAGLIVVGDAPPDNGQNRHIKRQED